MDNIKKSALTFIIVSFLVAVAILLGSLALFHSSRLDERVIQPGSLKTALVFSRALAGTLSLLPQAVVFVFALSFSVLFTLSPFRKGLFEFNNIAVPSFSMLIVFLIIITMSELYFVPLLLSRAERITNDAKKTQSALARANVLFEQQDYNGVLKTLDLYFELDGGDRAAQELYKNALDRNSGSYPRTQAAVSTAAPPMGTGSALGESEPSFYERGRMEYERGNYYSALFYLERARKLHQDNKEIAELYERSRKKAYGALGKITGEEMEKKLLIEQKEQALALLDSEPQQSDALYEAYRIFSNLSRRYPQLEDLSLYLATVEKKLLEVDFLASELLSHEWLPGALHLVFLDTGGYVNTVKKAVQHEGKVYFYDISRYHTITGETVQAKYGKFMGDRILLKNQEGFGMTVAGEEGRYTIRPFVSPLYLLSMDRGIEQRLTVYERFTVSDGLVESGLDLEGRFVWLSRKLGILFAVYTLSLFLAGMGWKRRSTYKSPSPLKLLLFSATLPVVAYLLFLLYTGMNDVLLYAHRYFARLINANVNPLVFVGIINAAIGIAATAYFLSQKAPGSDSDFPV
jgi:tetratricopeptide (TPR) repeat protein